MRRRPFGDFSYLAQLTFLLSVRLYRRCVAFHFSVCRWRLYCSLRLAFLSLFDMERDARALRADELFTDLAAMKDYQFRRGFQFASLADEPDVVAHLPLVRPSIVFCCAATCAVSALFIPFVCSIIVSSFLVA